MSVIPELQTGQRPFKPLRCPHCESDLRGKAAIVAATHNCTACGRRAMDPPKRDDGPLFSPEQFDTACAAYVRAWRRAGRLFVVGFLVLMGTFFVLAAFRDAIRPAIRPVMDPSFFLLLALLPGIAIDVVGLVILERAARALKCPHCDGRCAVVKAPHDPNLTRLTGNCANCGRRVVKESPAADEEPDGPLPTIDEFAAADRRVPLPTWLAWLVMVPMAALMIVYTAANPNQLWTTFEQRYGVVIGTTLAFALLGGYGLAQIVIGVTWIRWVERRHKRKRAAEPLLNCPHCREGLSPARLVIASRRCPKCRARVLAEPEPALIGSAP
jgi:hypothetical protein